MSNPLNDRLRYHVTGAIERGEGTAIVAMEVTELQRARLDSMRIQWDAVTAYLMPADHRHSPSMIIAVLEMAPREGDPESHIAVTRLHPDGRRESINDAYNRVHFTTDARNEGRRI